MKAPSFAEVLVVLTVPPDVEEAVVDWLLAREQSTGFTSLTVSGHSTSHEGMSAVEQVTGRQRRHQFQVQLTADAVERFLEEAAASFGAAGVHYWMVPLLGGGHLASAPDPGRDRLP